MISKILTQRLSTPLFPNYNHLPIQQTKNFNLIKFFKEIFSSVRKTSFGGTIKYVSKKESQAICEQNFMKQLQEAEKVAQKKLENQYPSEIKKKKE